MGLNILLSDGHGHFHTVFLLNTATVAQNTWADNVPANCYGIVENYSNVAAPVSAASGNGVTITANPYKPIYIWAYKKGNMRTYTYSNSTIGGKSTLHTTKDAHSKASTGDANSCLHVSLAGTTFVVSFGPKKMQVCSMENPDYEPISPLGESVKIQIVKHRLDIPAPPSSFGIGIGWYGTHISPARDLDKAIVR